jgi:hypothetical protein
MVVALATISMSGCGRSIAVDPPAADATGRCAPILDALPERLEQLPRRAIEPTWASVVAWGDPPILIRCGVATPSSLTSTSELTVVDGVPWFAETRDDRTIFTTVDAPPLVEVSVPRAYAPEAGVLVNLAPALSAANPRASATP